ncbi:MAG: hypothetical protein ACLUSK_13965 [Bacteroides stercoris]
MWLLALLPFRVLYILSDGLYLFDAPCACITGAEWYVHNLKNSFPEKSAGRTCVNIEREFYHYICDYMLEEVKMLRMSFEELCRRMEYDNKEEYLAMIEKHGGIVCADTPLC